MVDISNKLEGKVVSITGASGYIGSALTQELEKYSLKIIRISRKKLAPKYGVEDWVLDLNKQSSWIRIVKKSDIIFHLSGNTSIYSAEKDPKESKNLIKELPEVAQKMKSQINRFTASVQDSIAGKDYPNGIVHERTERKFWFESEEYRQYFDMFWKRVEYKKWQKKAELFWKKKK